MRRKWMNTLFALALLVVPFVAQPVVAYAACGSGSNSQQQVLDGIGDAGSDCTDTGVTNLVSAAVTILSFVAGIAAVIMIVISGLRYVTSGGDSGKVASAKNALIYALVGIAVAALAQLLVHFALHAAHCATDNTDSAHVSADCKS